MATKRKYREIGDLSIVVCKVVLGVVLMSAFWFLGKVMLDPVIRNNDIRVYKEKPVIVRMDLKKD